MIQIKLFHVGQNEISLFCFLGINIYILLNYQILLTSL